MDISNQIKKHRVEMGLSQDELAERIYVSRQTISSWENDKTYPDVQSLLLLSVLFDMTIDELVKGDREMMDKAIANDDAKKMKRLSWVMVAGCVLAVALAVSGAINWGPVVGIGLLLVVWLPTMAVAFSIERLKQKNDVQTYREIAAFMDGKSFERDERFRQSRSRQIASVAVKIVAGMASGLILGFFVMYAASAILGL